VCFFVPCTAGVGAAYVRYNFTIPQILPAIPAKKETHKKYRRYALLIITAACCWLLALMPKTR